MECGRQRIETLPSTPKKSVRPELVEGLSFFHLKRTGFDKLSPNGFESEA
jgi:hypothetical protein